jgi:phosphatidylserine/phosphatidylglycerophosphate/cardiolipin synthase-like enzyme
MYRKKREKMKLKVKTALYIYILCFFGSLSAKESVAYFSAETDLAKKCIECIQKEVKSIRIASRKLSNVDVILALSEAHKRGVLVEVIVDAKSVTKNPRLRLLSDEGALVLVWKAESKRKEYLQHSFCLFGDESTWVGSYSFSLEKKFSHKESVVLLEGKEVFESFSREFDLVKKGSSLSLSEYLKDL